ncbi:TRAP transporter substrate-binding protein DctP [Roseospira goensis]|uniref:Tripartite ATP-independent transporter DctP family solute receptor n=1 Tax=Roseospira goensis TaxID=391922 RepID=A0A7W6RZE9_9PROT|nr:TRAP transporter substrate-binding protein DctP [Roseospira goensis]MBB4285372.1 tripartite ATP-independent transporter DctP family solute receptor [Roseospira goensis]
MSFIPALARGAAGTAGAAALAALMLATPAAAETTVRMSYNGPPEVEKNAVHRFATNFQTLVELRTNGEIKVELYPNSQLGKEAARMEQVMTGPMVNVASLAGMQSVFPEIFAANAPFLFESYEAAHQFYEDSDFWDEATAAFKEETGAYLLEAVEEGGFLAFTNDERPIQGPADFEGLKFRAMDESQVALYEAFGASGTPVPWTEVYTALKTGVADGQMNPPMYIIIGSLYEVQDYLTLANIQYSMQFLVVNGDWLDGLPEDQRAAVVRAAHDANVINRIWVEAEVQKRINYLVENGMEPYTPTAEEMAAFRAQGQSAYNAWLAERIDQAWIDLATASAEAANAAHSAR